MRKNEEREQEASKSLKQHSPFCSQPLTSYLDERGSRKEGRRGVDFLGHCIHYNTHDVRKLIKMHSEHEVTVTDCTTGHSLPLQATSRKE